MKRYMLIVLILLCHTVWATPLSDLNRLLLGFTDLKANFDQTVMTEQGAVLQKSSGTFAIKKPGKFRWDKKTPVSQLIIANGETVWIYDPDLEQITQRSLKGSAGDTPAMLLSGQEGVLEKSFTVTNFPHQDHDTWFKLVSKDPSSMTPVIILAFHGKMIASMQLHDSIGHITDIQFNDVDMNRNLKNSLFNFVAPKGVDIIRE